MKKVALVLFASLFVVQCFASVGSYFLGLGLQFNEKDTLRYYSLISANNDQWESKLIKSIGSPIIHNAGAIVWEHVAIDGIGKDLKISLKDGIMTHNKQERSACWKPFQNDKEKQMQLNSTTINQERETTIYILNEKGDNCINSEALQKIMKTFLDKALKS